ncbi:universal stress protein [Shewanella gelidimarina]|uniref:universal stress protein n=1 Tax=Shewanella gelidimarina TaxID=56813 RepID=UPI0020108CE9|nr:universal stress protein [Shewanella gelidimarina]MCL1057475.1 universal stress protein [Shewanella gelidimarina]
MKNIVACIDGSKLTLATCEASAWVAQKVKAPLTLLHVLDKATRPVVSELSGQIGFGSQEDLLNELVELDELRSKVALKHGKQLLVDAEELAQVRGVSDIHKLQRHGSLLDTLMDLEDELRLLVLGRSGEDHSTAKTIGSQLESVIRTIKAHTLVVSESFEVPSSYMVAFDGSATSDKLIEKAIKTPLLVGLECHLVMVNSSGDKSAAFQHASQQLTEAGIMVTERVLTGDVDSALLDYQEQQQLGMIVMGAYGHTKLRQYFLGSNTTQVLIKSSVPLLLIR